MQITIKGVPPSLNVFAGRQNSWQYRKIKERWTSIVRLSALESHPPDRPYQYAEVRLDYFFPTAGRRDPDNYAGKLLLDGLTQAKVITDDDFQHISLSLHGHVDRHNPRTVITVTEVEL